MSRSVKKHVGGKILGPISEKEWKRIWHGSFRAKVRDLLIFQTKFLEEDLVYPHINEVGDLWLAPSDGGSHWWKEQDFTKYLECEMRDDMYRQLRGTLRIENGMRIFNDCLTGPPLLSLKQYKRQYIARCKGK